MRRVAIVNQKGGCGKTTTALNLSAGLALSGRKVVLIDLDPQANASTGLSVTPDRFSKGMDDLIKGRATVGEVLVRTEIENLHLIPSRIHLDSIELELISAVFREKLLARVLDTLSGYDCAIIDCRPTLGLLTINALYASETVIVPCEMSRYSLDGFSDLMRTIDEVKRRHSSEFIRILLTKYESRNTITNQWVMDQLTAYMPYLFKTKIRRNEALNQAHMVGEPIFAFKPDSIGAADYRDLTEEVVRWLDR